MINGLSSEDSKPEKMLLLVYVASEKRPSQSKNFKAGTLNVLVNSFFCLLQMTRLFYVICCSVSHSLILIFSFMVLIWCLQLNSQGGIESMGAQIWKLIIMRCGY